MQMKIAKRRQIWVGAQHPHNFPMGDRVRKHQPIIVLYAY